MSAISVREHCKYLYANAFGAFTGGKAADRFIISNACHGALETNGFGPPGPAADMFIRVSA